MSIYRGHFAEISNKADWVSPVIDFVDDETGDTIDLSEATEIYFEIKDPETHAILVAASLADGRIATVETDKFQITIPRTAFSNLDAGQYLANFSFTLDDLKHDPVLATISVLEGAGS